MSSFDIVRAWKDAEYRQSLGAEEQAQLPEHPAGSIALEEADLNQVVGAVSLCCSYVTGCDACTDMGICTLTA